MTRTYGAQGFVLKRTNLGEADRLITFLLKYKGKITVIAKGIRKVASRKSPNLELLNLVKIYLAKGKNFDVITEASAIKTYKDLKSNLNKVSFGFYLTELVNEFLAEGQGGREVFEIFAQALELINDETDIEKIKLFTRSFEMKLLDYIGFKPELYYCVKCHRIINPSGNFLSPEVGGVVEGLCRENIVMLQPISKNTLSALRFLQKEDWQKIRLLAVSRELNVELEQKMRFYLEYLLEKELKSLKFINELDRFKALGSNLQKT